MRHYNLFYGWLHHSDTLKQGLSDGQSFDSQDMRNPLNVQKQALDSILQAFLPWMQTNCSFLHLFWCVYSLALYQTWFHEFFFFYFEKKPHNKHQTACYRPFLPWRQTNCRFFSILTDVVIHGHYTKHDFMRFYFLYLEKSPKTSIELHILGFFFLERELIADFFILTNVFIHWLYTKHDFILQFWMN